MNANSRVDESDHSAQRIDKWLWAARFFKTRNAAATAVSGGHVHVDGERVKPSRRVAPGARLRVRRGTSEWEVIVEALNPHRRPASEAQALYAETAESMEARAREAERRQLENLRREQHVGRPDKRGRRELGRLKRSE